MKIQLIEQKVHSNIAAGRIFRLLAEKDGREIISPALITMGSDKEMVIFLRKFNNLYKGYEEVNCFAFNKHQDRIYQLSGELKAMKDKYENHLQ